MDRAVLYRAEQAGEEEEVRRVVENAFGGTREADLVDAFRASPDWIDELSVVAEWDGRLVGHVLFTRIIGGCTA